MDFIGFDYTNFLQLNISDSNYSFTTDFLVHYSQVDSRTFKINIKSISSATFSDLVICAITNDQANTLLQTALNGYPLSTSVYLADICATWSSALQYSLFTDN